MFKNIFGGIAVGIANIIPGVSGGTMMVILGIFNPVMESISNVIKKENANRLKDILFLTQIIIGAGIGLVVFANIIEVLFTKIPTQTMWWFIGLILFSIPSLLKSELKDKKLNIAFLLIGLAVIFSISYFNPGKTEEMVVTVFPAITALYLLKMVLLGMISGASMLMPGVSGSMVLLILGEYYIFKSYIANILTFDLLVLIPLVFIGFGIVLGIVLSAKIMTVCLKNSREKTISLILGLVIASGIVLIPSPLGIYTGSLLITSIVSFALGAVIVTCLEKVVNK